MGEPFHAIGFNIIDEASYQALAEEAQQRGTTSKVKREQGVIHGCCWSIGAGLEVWTMLYESKDGLFYADCRPAFRARHVFSLYPWEIAEYEEDGEAVARGGLINSGVEMVFELQNITEVDLGRLRDRQIMASVSGLAYRARVTTKIKDPLFAPLAERYPRRKAPTEVDYAVRGRILSWREIKNPLTASDLILIDVDAGKLRLEVLLNRADLKGELKAGGWLASEVWMQGHILSDKDLQARYEGLDRQVYRGSFWEALRREI
ncbi:MAG: DUF3881 family protein [Blastocatellia bacterium]